MIQLKPSRSLVHNSRQIAKLLVVLVVTATLFHVMWQQKTAEAADTPSDVASAPAQRVAASETVYTQNFEGAIGSEWSDTSTSIIDGRTFLGQYRDNQVTLSLDNLPTHQQLTIAFQLYTIGSWDGVHPEQGPELWGLEVISTTTLISTTFSVWDHPDTAWWQSYPDSYASGLVHEGMTGADETISDTFIYYLTFTFNHTDEAVEFLFTGNLGGNDDEFWGIDNLVAGTGTSIGIPDPGQTANVRLHSEDIQSNPSAAIGSNGAGYEVWTDGRNGFPDILYSDNGNYQFINDNLDYWQFDPDLVMDENDGQYAIWVDQRNGGSNDIFFSYRPSPYDPWGTNEIVNSDATPNDQYSPALAVDSSGNAYAVWVDRRNDYQEDIYFVYRPAGGPWQPDELVTTAVTTTIQYVPDIAVDDSGNAYVVWADGRNGNRDIYFAYRPAGGGSWTEEQVNDVTNTAWPDGRVSPSIAVDATGNAVVVWTDERSSLDVYSDYRPAGGSWGTDTLVTDDAGTDYQGDPDVTIGADGTTYVVWADSRGEESYDNIFFATRPLTGTVWSSYETVPGFPSGMAGWRAEPSVSVNVSGTVHIAYVQTLWVGTHWDSNINRVYWSAGSGWYSEGQANLNDGGIDQRNPAIVVDPSNDPRAVWEDNHLNGSTDIFYSYSGEWGGGFHFRVNDGSINEFYNQYNPDYAIDPYGNEYAIWVDDRNVYCYFGFICYYDIYFSYRPAGGQWGPNERVNDVPNSIVAAAVWDWDLVGPSIAVDSNGNAYAVWADDRERLDPGSDREIYFAYRPAGGSWGTNERINDVPDEYDRSSPTIAVDPNGNAYATWIDGRNGDGLIVYGAYRPAGSSWETDERIDPFGSSSNYDPVVAMDDAGNVYAAWQDVDVEYNLRFATRPAGSGGSWGSSEQVDDSTTADYIDGIAIDVDNQGNPAVVWMESRSSNEDIYFSRRLADGGWGVNVLVNDDGGSESQFAPTLVVDGAGIAHIAWTDERDSYAGQDIYYTRYNPSLVSPVSSFVQVDTANVVADDVDYATITVTLLDIYGDPLSNRELLLTATGDNVTLDPISGYTDSNGQFQTIIRSTVAQTAVISAQDIASSTILNDHPEVTFTPGPMDPATSTADPLPEFAIANTETVVISATVRDAFNNLIPGREFGLQIDSSYYGYTTYDTVTSDENGRISYNLTWSQLDYLSIYLQDADYTSILFVGDIEFINGPVNPADPNNSLYLSTNAIYAGEEVYVDAYLYAMSGNPAADRDFELLLDGSVVGVSNMSGGEGGTQAMQFYFYPTQAGTFPVELRDTQYDVYIPVGTLLVRPSYVDWGASTFTAVPDTIAPNHAEASVFTATLTDTYGNLITDRTYDLRLYSNITDTSHYFGSDTADSNGQVVYTITWPTSELLWLDLYSSELDDYIITQVPITVGAGALSPLNSIASISPTAILGNSIDTAVISATLRDTTNTPIAYRPIHLRTNGYTVLFGETDANGQVIFNFASPFVSDDVVIELFDPAYDVLWDIGRLDLLPGPVSDLNSDLQTSDTTLAADGLDSAILTVTVRDLYDGGRPMPNTPVTISVTGTVTLTQASLTTNALGVVTATLRSTDLQTAQVTAVADGILLADTLSIEFIPGPATAAQSTLNIVPSQVIADGVHTAVINGILRDAVGHVIPNRPFQIQVSGSDNLLQPASPITTGAAGEFSFTLASTTIETKTVALLDTVFNAAMPVGTIEFTTPARSTAEANPLIVTADNVDTAVLTVTLRNTDDTPIVGEEVAVQLTSGSLTNLNGAPLTAGQWITIGVSGPDGVVTATLTSTLAEVKSLIARSQTQTITDLVQVQFVPGPASQLQILLPGETATPGAAPGYTGTPASQTAGQPFTATVLAVDAYWNVVTTVTDTVQLSSSDPAATLPLTVTLAAGTAVFSTTHFTADSHTLSADDLSNPAINDGISQNFVVAPAAASRLELTLPAATQILDVLDITLAAYDPYNNLATGYTGQVQFSSSDSQATLPANYTFTIGDAGDHTFADGLIFRTAGSQIITITDILQPSLVAIGTVAVSGNVVITTNTTWNETAVSLNSLTVTNNATLTLQGTPTLTATTLTVDSGAAISADGQGYGSASGPGAGTNGAWAYNPAGGAGHGGYGGDSSSGRAGGTIYNDVYQPQLPGSGGGLADGFAGGAGGGAIHLIVTDAFTLNGTLRSNGINGNGDFGASGGGAGGSIWLEADTISGNGVISANGGAGGGTRFGNAYGIAGGGAGGRIAIYAQTNSFGGTFQAIGGTGGQAGGAGTIYTHNLITGDDLLLIDNADRNGESAGLLVGSYQFDQILLQNSGHLSLLDTNSVLTVTNGSLTGDGTARLSNNGRIFGDSHMIIDGATLVVRGDLTGPTDLTLQNSGGLELYANTPWRTGVYTFSNITINNGSTLRLVSYNNGNTTYTDDYGITLHLDNLNVAAGGTVASDGVGYGAASGPGAGANSSGVGNPAGGGGYGGRGHNGTGGAAGGATYGSIYQPTDLGSGGGNNNFAGAAGGGAIHLIISDTLTLDGIISANGATGSGDFEASGGGSGGSIWIETNSLTGAGTVSANGGNGGSTRLGNAYGRGGGGGGGRIAIYAAASTFTGSYSLNPGSGGSCPTDCLGTLYLNNVDPAGSTLEIAPTSVVANNINTATVTVTLRMLGGAPVVGSSVELRVVPASGVTINGQPAGSYINIGATDVNGVVTAVLASNVLGSVVVDARTVAGERLLQTASLTFTVGPADADASQLTASKTSIVADNTDQATLTATLYDAQLHPLAGREVVILAPGSNITLNQSSPTTNAAGQVQATIRSTDVQTVTVTAVSTADNITFTQNINLSFTPAPAVAANSTIVVSPTTALANNLPEVTITATLVDILGRPLAGRPIQLNVTGSNNSITPASQQTADANGTVTFYLASSKAETKQLSLLDVQGGVTLPAGMVAFQPVPVSASNSLLTVLGNSTAAANGQQAIAIQVTARDTFNNPIPGVTVVLTSTGQVQFVQPSVTDGNGRATGYVTSSMVQVATIRAIVDGVLINPTANLSFEGPDLSLNVTAPADVTAGYPITYNLTIANEGYLTATNIVVTDTLPFHTTFVTHTAPYAYTYNTTTRELVWQVGTLAAGTNTSFIIRADVSAGAPINGALTNAVNGTVAEPELDNANNLDSVGTLVIPPTPRLTVTPLYPTLVVPTGLSNTLVVTVTNTGTGAITGLSIFPPANTPWATVSETNFGTLLPRQWVTFTVTADSSSVSNNGRYRDRIRVNTTNTGYADIFADIHVRPPLRDLTFAVTNNLGDPVPGASITLVEYIYIVTEGSPATQTYYRQGTTTTNGQVTFYSLETDKSYNYSLTAANHDPGSGSVNVVEGSGSQQQAVVLNGLAGLGVSPGSMTFAMLRGELSQQELIIRNTGVADLTGIEVSSSGIPFLFLGQPPVGTILAPGETITVTVNAAPLESEVVDIYNGSVLVTADNGQSTTVPVQVALQDVLARDLCIEVRTDLGNPLTNAEVRLTDQLGQVISNGGITETVQQMYVQNTGNTGFVCFQDLHPGPYHADVGRGEIRLGQKDIEVVPGEDVQEEVIIVDEPSVTATWSVIPTTIEDVYTTVLTLTFIPHAVPQLAFSPDRINLCGDADGTVTQIVTLHNFYPITLTNAVLNLSYGGNVTASIRDPETGAVTGGGTMFIGELEPNEHRPFELTASVNMATCQGDQGLININVEAEYNHLVPESFYHVDPTNNPTPPGQESRIPLKLANVGFPTQSNLNSIPPALENVTLIPPQLLTWMDVSTTTIPLIEVGEEADFELIVTPPQYLAEGLYYDYIQIKATNGITALIGIEAEMTATGLEVSTQFVTPLTAGEGGGGNPPGGNNPPIQIGQPPEDWDDIITFWNPDIFGPQEVIVGNWNIMVGCYCASGGGGGWGWVGNHLIYVQGGSPGPGFAYSPDFKDNVVILELQQRFSLDREAFNAQLNLSNGLAESLTDVEVSIVFMNGTGNAIPTREQGVAISPTGNFTPVLPINSLVPTNTIMQGTPGGWQKIYPVHFITIPETPTAIGEIGGGQNEFMSWTLVPDAPGLTEQAYFTVQAIIRYKVNGVEKTLVTSASTITVSPQPRIVIDYFIPNYVLGGQTFDWLVVATNVGYGTARNFRVETPQPKIIKQSEMYPTSFTLIGPSVLNWGDVEPGEQVSGIWRILPSNPGSFVDWKAACRHQNYMGVELPELVYCTPRIHFIDTSYLAPEQQRSKGDSCLGGLFSAFSGDPVSTLSGNFTYTDLDINIPGWGAGLQLERTYNSDETDDGPFGPGWTHSYNMDLEYKTLIGRDKETNQISQITYFAASLPHGSVAHFAVSPDGNTITPFPGVKATLTRDFVTYTLLQECNQMEYTYNAAQQLTAVEDPNGNRTELSYDVNGNLISVTDESGRSLTFTYDGNNHITSITDPMGRTAVYGYTNGYLTSAQDFRGQVTNYTYTLPGDQPGKLRSIVDPNGNTEVWNDYDENGRVEWQEDALGNRTTFTYNVDVQTEARSTITTDELGLTTTDYYNSDGLLIRQEDTFGNDETYDYDEDFNRIRMTDKNGRITLYEWDECGCELLNVVDPMGNTTTMSYNAQHQVLTVENERGHVTTYAYDGTGINPLSITDPIGGSKTYTYGTHGEKLTETDENGNTTAFAYDPYGNTTVITDALGYVTTMGYDIVGRMLSSTNALGNTTTYTYDPGNKLLSTTDPLSGTITFTYDAVGNVTSVTDALGRIVTYEYDARNMLIRTTDPAGGVKEMVYDANRNLIAETDANGNTTTYTLQGYDVIVTNPLAGTITYVNDPVGNRLSETDANGNTTQYEYDANNRVIRTIYPDGSQMTAVYDQADHLLRLTDGEGRTVIYTYDQMGRVRTKTDPESGLITYTYDAASNLIETEDAEGRVTQYTYDALNRLVSTTDPEGGLSTFTYDALGQQISATDPNGNTATMSYDDLNRLAQVIDPLSGTTTFSYDAVGNRVQTTDPLGRVTIAEYDALNRPITITNPLNGTMIYDYDAIGNVLAVTDQEGRTTEYIYDDLYRVLSITNALSGTTTFTYDANGNVLSQTDAEGRTTTYAYDAFNQVVTTTNPLGGVMVYDYDHVGNVLQATDPNNHTLAYVYDGLDRVIAATDSLSGTTQFGYDAVSNLLTLTDPEGNTITAVYDGLNRPINVANALGHTNIYEYDPAGNLVRLTDAEGNVTEYSYDELNRLVTLTDALGHVTTYSYDAVSNQVGLVDALGREMTFGYDALNRLTTMTNPISGTTVYTYSAAGSLLAERNPNDQVTTYAYDALYRPILVTDPLGQNTAFTYDAVGNLLTSTDPLNRTTTFVYDDLNRLVQMTNPIGGAYSMAYDAVGNQVSETDANGRITAFTYDALNRLTAVTDPLSQVTTFSYDAVGNQLSLTDPLGRTTSFDYDNIYRLTTLTDPAGQPTTYTYDQVDNLLSTTDPLGRTTSFVYDALNRPIIATNPLSGTMQFTYDAVGNQTGITDAAGRVMTYTYDALDRLASLIDPLSNVTQYQYDPLGNLTSLTDALGRITTYQYDDLNRLTATTNPLSGQTFFTYDAVGNLTGQVDPLGNTTRFTFDALDRLLSVTDALSQTSAYTYDPVGNLLTVTDANGAVSQMAYDALNRLTAYTNPLGQVSTYAYDAVGNQTSLTDPLGHQTNFTYDVLDRLVNITDALGRTSTYQYDPVGNQVGMTDAEGTATRYQYDSLNRLTNVTENYLSGGPQNAATNVTTQFAYDPVGNMTSMTNPLGNTFTYSYDALNRMTTSSDPLGYSNHYTYDAVGNLVGMEDPNQNNITYSYDALNRLTTIVRPDELVSFSYDAVGNRLSMSDLTGLTQYTYDAVYRLLSVTDPLSQTLQYTYDAAGNRTGLAYPDGEQVTYEYDAANQLVTVTDWDNGETQYTYDANGRLTQILLPNGITGTMGYDAANQLTLLQYEGLTGTLASYVYSYDQVGNRIEALETVVMPDLVPTAIFTATPRTGAAPLDVVFYNTSINADTYIWEFGDGQVLTTTSLLTLTHTYSQTGVYTVTLTAESDDFSHTLQRTNYILVVPPDAFQESGGQVVMEAENFLAAIPRNGQSWMTRTAVMGYQGNSYLQALPDRNRLYATDYITSSPELQFEVNFATAGTYTVWVYGSALNARADSVHVGLNGQANPSSQAITGFRPRQWSWSSQTEAGTPATLTIPAPGLYTLNIWVREDGFRFDRLVLTTNTGFVPTGGGPAESPRAGDVSAALFGVADSTTSSWFTVKQDGMAGVAGVQNRTNKGLLAARMLGDPGLMLMGPLALLAPFAMKRKKRGELQALTAVLVILALFGISWALVYGAGFGMALGADLPFVPLPSNKLNPFVEDANSLGNHQALFDLAQQNSVRSITYAYDPLYRLTAANYSTGESFNYTYDAASNRLTSSVNGAPPTSYVYDVANRLIQMGSQVYTYDNNGNLLNDGDYTYTYDTANRLTRVDDGISTIDYNYNGDGVRVAQTVDGIRTDYVQDIARPLPQALTARQGGTVSKYLYGLGLIAEERGGTGPFAAPAVWQYTLPDALGSIRQITDAAGNVTLGQHFDPFGGLMASGGSGTSAFGFAGEEQDPLTGLVYLRARTYDPTTGRFLQQDSVFGDPSQPRTLNRYTYAFNSPLTYTDPSGHMPAYSSGYASGGKGGVSSSSSSNGGITLYRQANQDGNAGGGDGGGGGGGGGLCGFLSDVVETAVDIGEEVLNIATNLWDMGKNLVEFALTGDFNNLIEAHDSFQAASQSARNILSEVSGFIERNEAIMTALLQVAIGFIPIVGTLYDIASLALGYDLITGEKLTDAEKLLTVAGLFMGGFDELGELFEAGVKNADELATGARSADELSGLKRMDEPGSAHKTGNLGDMPSANKVDNVRKTGEVNNLNRADNAPPARNTTQPTPTRNTDIAQPATRNCGCTCSIGGNSFTAGTLVETDEGQIPIEDVEVGDKVLAEDPETGEQGYYEVVALTDHPTDEIVEVTVEVSDEEDTDDTDDEETDTHVEVMQITADHPVYVEGQGWVLAENLGLGERLRRADGGMAKVLAIEHKHLDDPVSVYNFTVKGPHTYFVLESELLVHNTSCEWDPRTQRWHDSETRRFISWNEAAKRDEHIVIFDEMPGREVDIDEASKLSGIPREYLENISEAAGKTGTICGLRTCNPLIDKLDETTWPKDPTAEVYHPVKTDEKLKIGSDQTPKFKTTEHGLVGGTLEIDGKPVQFGVVRRPNGDFELVEMEKIVNPHTGEIILDPSQGLPMGPDVDTYFFIQKHPEGHVNLGTDTLDEVAVREQLSEATNVERAGINQGVPAIVHGPAQPYFGTVKNWGDALVVMPNGKFIWLRENEIESFFHYHGLTTFTKGPKGQATNWLKDWLERKP